MSAHVHLHATESAAPTRRLQRKCACGSGGSEPCSCPEKKEAQRSALDGGARNVAVLLPDHSAGQALPADVRTRMARAFAFDFGQVRIHADERAAEAARGVSARAYTVGRDVVFGAGEYAPRTSRGARLLAHELTHVVQQSKGALSSNESEAEREADRAAAGIEPEGETR